MLLQRLTIRGHDDKLRVQDLCGGQCEASKPDDAEEGLRDVTADIVPFAHNPPCSRVCFGRDFSPFQVSCGVMSSW